MLRATILPHLSGVKVVELKSIEEVFTPFFGLHHLNAEIIKVHKEEED